MKRVFFFIVCIVLLQTTIGYAQESASFVYIEDKPDYQRPMSMVEFEDCYIILNSYYTMASGDNDRHDFLLKIDKQGHKVDEKTVENPYGDNANPNIIFVCRQIVKLPDNNIAILGAINREGDPTIYDFYYAIYDNSLNKISERFIYKPYGELVQANAFLNSKGRVVLYGGLSPDSGSGIYNHCFIAEFSLDGELLNLYANDYQNLIGVIWDMVEEEDGSYLAVQHNVMPNNDGVLQNAPFCRFNSDLSIKQPYCIVDPDIISMASYGDIIPATDTSFILASRVTPLLQRQTRFFFSIAAFDTACQLIDSTHYSDPSTGAVNYPSYWQCADIDKTNPNAFFASYFSPMQANTFYNGPSTIFTYKFNTDGTEQWLRTYGGADSAAYFQGCATYATQDGGVLLLNTRHAFYSGEDSDVLIVKYDKDGALSIEDTDIEPQKINCYPNPATSELHIDIPMHNGKPYLLQVYDICGKLIKETTLYNANNTIDVSQWSSGVYTYSLQQAHKSTAHGKWIKR